MVLLLRWLIWLMHRWRCRLVYRCLLYTIRRHTSIWTCRCGERIGYTFGSFRYADTRHGTNVVDQCIGVAQVVHPAVLDNTHAFSHVSIRFSIGPQIRPEFLLTADACAQLEYRCDRSFAERCHQTVAACTVTIHDIDFR